MELLIVRNPDPDSRLPFLLRLPLGEGLVFRTSGTWPRTTALYCYPVPVAEWPAEPELVERVPLRSCVRRGAAIDVVFSPGAGAPLPGGIHDRSGRDAVFWQSPRTRKQARPGVRTPTAQAAGVAELEIVVDAYEQYPYRFTRQGAVRVVRQALPAGDYGVTVAGRLVAAVERKSLPDLVTSLTTGKLKYALGELAALPRAAVVVEDRYSQVFTLDHVRPAMVADGLAELQVGWPTVAMVFCETRRLAEEWTYRYLAAAKTWADGETEALARIPKLPVLDTASKAANSLPRSADGPSTAQLRAWARTVGLVVADRGRLPPHVWERWYAAHAEPGLTSGWRTAHSPIGLAKSWEHGTPWWCARSRSCSSGGCWGSVALGASTRGEADCRPVPARRLLRLPSPPRSAFAGFRFPPEVIVLAVRWYLHFGLSYRDVEELLAERGVEVDHVTIYRWVQRFTPLLAEAARPCRHAVGDRWFVDETYGAPRGADRSSGGGRPSPSPCRSKAMKLGAA